MIQNIKKLKKIFIIIFIFYFLSFFLDKFKTVFSQEIQNSGYYRNWNITVNISCPPGKYFNKKTNLFYAVWPPENLNAPPELRWNYITGNENEFVYKLKYKLNIETRNRNGNLYLGVMIRDKIERPITPRGFALANIELKPKNNPPSSNIHFGKFFNPQTYMIKISPEASSGEYFFEFEPQEEYLNLICKDTPPICKKTPQKSFGDADNNCLVDEADYEIWKREFSRKEFSRNGDFNGDNNVNLIDYEIWRKNFYTFVGDIEDLPLFGPTLTPTLTPTLNINPTITPEPTQTITPTPYPTSLQGNQCMWCGRSCVPYQSGRFCPMVLPPEGASCVFNQLTGQCEIVYE